jgi:O-acetyl-ADP-ribose deacetylase (regulator of RNase III)
MIVSMKHPQFNLVLEIAQGSLTDGNELVLVNASNTNAELGTGVSGAIRRSCGPGFQEHVTRTMRTTFGSLMEPGDVFLTHAGKHPTARWVAHVAVMDYRQGFSADSYPTKDLIATCCKNLWETLEKSAEPSLSVAMVALGAGTGQLGVRYPTEVACDTLFTHHLKNPKSKIQKVVFYGYELNEFLVIAEVLSKRLSGFLETLPIDVQSYLQKWKN